MPLKDNTDRLDMPKSNGPVILKDAFPPDHAFVTDLQREQSALKWFVRYGVLVDSWCPNANPAVSIRSGRT